MWEMLNLSDDKFLARDSEPKVLTGGWSCRHPQVPKFQTPKGKQTFSRNHITCTMSHCYVEKVLCHYGNCLPVRSSNASQGQADLSKDSSLGPAMLPLLCTPSMTFALPYFEGKACRGGFGPGMEEGDAREKQILCLLPNSLYFFHFFPLFSEIVYVYFKVQLKFISVLFHTRASALASGCDLSQRMDPEPQC